MQRAWELQTPAEHPAVVCVAPPFRSTQPEKVKQLHLSRQQQKVIVGRNDDVFSPVISRVPSWPLATFAAARPMFGGELNNTFVHNVWRGAAVQGAELVININMVMTALHPAARVQVQSDHPLLRCCDQPWRDACPFMLFHISMFSMFISITLQQSSHNSSS